MNGQFIIPSTQEALTEVTRSFEHGFPEAELGQTSIESYYQIREKIEQYRRSATEATLPRSTRMRVAEVFNLTHRPLEERLIEEESAIGGRLFQTNEAVVYQRFWYYSKDWFFERLERRNNEDVQIVMQYHIDDTGVHKIINGSEYSIDIEEKNRLLLATERYEQSIRRELYDLAA